MLSKIQLLSHSELYSLMFGQKFCHLIVPSIPLYWCPNFDARPSPNPSPSPILHWSYCLIYLFVDLWILLIHKFVLCSHPQPCSLMFEQFTCCLLVPIILFHVMLMTNNLVPFLVPVPPIWSFVLIHMLTLWACSHWLQLHSYFNFTLILL